MTSFIDDAKAQPGFTVRVLLIDPDPLVCRAIARELRSVAEVLVVADCASALEVLAHSSFDAVVSGKQGVPLFEEIRDRFPQMRRILVSGGAPLQLAEILTPASFDEYLPKPLPRGQLARAVLAGHTI